MQTFAFLLSFPYFCSEIFEQTKANMRNSNTDPTSSPSPTREGNLMALLNDSSSATLPSFVGEGLGVGSVSLVI